MQLRSLACLFLLVGCSNQSATYLKSDIASEQSALNHHIESEKKFSEYDAPSAHDKQRLKLVHEGDLLTVVLEPKAGILKRANAQSPDEYTTTTVSVVKVLPDGAIKVSGDELINFNSECKYMRLAGWVSAKDLRQNSVLSSQSLLDARLVYGGREQVERSCNNGWLTVYFDSPWVSNW